MQPGIELLLDAAHFDDLLDSADIVFTGEGCIDSQSLHGKVPFGVARRAREHNVPCVALCGCTGEGAELIYEYGITAIFSAVSVPTDFETIKLTCRDDLYNLADSVVRLLVSMN